MIRTPIQRKAPLKAGTFLGITEADMPPGVTLRRVPLKKKRKPMRIKGPKMTPARKAAKGQPCMIRLPGCTGGGDTTVLAHYRLAGYCGTGIKPPDEMGSWACGLCHAICDGRAPLPDGYSREQVRLAHAEGCMRTQMARRPA